ncbi:MAG: prolyl oligopeptidase family serine peptidase [Deltaproteobacteria bacterium]|nr:prolyl oligopeptidase family serine peptidase [Deltaproteobacteria bacterium]
MGGSGRLPDVLYLHGFASSPGSAKARAFAERLRPMGVRMVVPRLDGGDFARMTLSRALAVAEAAASGLSRGYAVIGSSMGGYLALRHALGRPVSAVVAMAPALDFPSSWERWMSPAELERWRETGWTELEHHETGRKERIAWDIVAESRQHPAIEEAPSCPVLVFHGLRDDVVPCGLSERLAGASPHVRLRLLDDDHSLHASLGAIVEESVEFLGGAGLTEAAP